MSESELQTFIGQIIISIFILWTGRERVIKPVLKLVVHPFYKNAIPFEPSEPSAKRLGRLYRRLAKKYHPDHARTLEQKVYFEYMMKRVNRAYTEKDILVLERLGHEQ